MIKQIIINLQIMLFDNPEGLRIILNTNTNNEEDMITQKLPKELGKELLAMDSIPGFLIGHEIGNYQNIIEISNEINQKNEAFKLKITVPIYKGWKSAGDPTCCISTYILYAVFCVGLKAEPYSRTQSTSV
ncbi:hypothetical protein OCOL_000670 [Ordospora colligata]